MQYSFIASVCADKLNIALSSLGREMVIDTPAMGSVTTSLVCAKCPLSVFGRDFLVDLIYLPLDGLDVILGMDWLVNNRVHINCFDRSISFASPVEEEASLLSAGRLRRLMVEEDQLYVLMASMSVENQAKIKDLPVVCEFLGIYESYIP